MRLLVIGLDPAAFDPMSSSADRQKRYYEGHDVDIVVLATGPRTELQLTPRIRVMRAGGLLRAAVVFRTALLVRRLCREKRYDAVTAQEPVACGGLALLCGGRVPFQLQDHSAFFGRRPANLFERVLGPWARFVARRASRVRTVSLRGKRGFESIGIPSDKIDVVPIPTDVSRFTQIVRSTSGHPRLLCIARLSREKGVDVLLRAFARVRSAHASATLTIVGDGPERASLEALASSLGISSAVAFAGRQTDVASFFADTDVYVQPSHYEGWGMAVIEAAAAGMPIIMSDVGCAGEVIVDGVSGVVVPPNNVQALSDAINSLLSNPSRAARLALEARRAAEKLPTVEHAVADVRRSLEQTALAPRRSPVWPLFVVSFGIRALLFFVILHFVGPKGFELGDTIEYLGLAHSLLSGGGFALYGGPFIGRTIAYPLFLASGIAVFGSTTGFVLFQVILASFIPLLVLRLGKQLRLGRRATWIAAWVAALEPHLVYYSTVILTESIYTLVLLIGIIYLFRAMETKRLRESVWAGVAFGIGMLIKPLLQFFAPFLLIVSLPWARRIALRETLKHAVVVLGVMGIVIFPWMVRNQRVSGSFTLTSQGSVAALYYLGTSIVSVRDHIPYEVAEAKIESQFNQVNGTNLPPSALSAAYTHAAMQYITANPGILLRIIAVNTLTFWTSVNYNSFLNYYHLIPLIDHSVLPPTHYLVQGRFGDFFAQFWKIFSQPFYLIGAVGRLVWIVITGLFLYGLIAAWRRIPDRRFQYLFVIALCLYLTATIWVDGLGIEARLRYPLMPFEFLFAAYGWTLLCKRRAKEVSRLFVITQRVDERDANLGFHLAWLRDFAGRFENVDVVAQAVGAYELPSNVHVASLGKEKGKSKVFQLVRFYCLAWSALGRCDAVLVLMVPTYVLLLAPLAFLRGKKMYLWYAHGHVPLTLRAALPFCAAIFTSSEKGFRINTPKRQVLGQAIDTDFYSPEKTVQRDSNTLVTVGRISPSKHLDVLIQMVRTLRDGGMPARLEIVGEAILESDRGYEQSLREMVTRLDLASAVTFHGGQPATAVRDWYRRAGMCLNASTTGSLDKAVLEAMACECPVVTCNEAFRPWLPSEALVASPDAAAFAKSVSALHQMPYDTQHVRTIVRERHERRATLSRLVQVMRAG